MSQVTAGCPGADAEGLQVSGGCAFSGGMEPPPCFTEAAAGRTVWGSEALEGTFLAPLLPAGCPRGLRPGDLLRRQGGLRPVSSLPHPLSWVSHLPAKLWSSKEGFGLLGPPWRVMSATWPVLSWMPPARSHPLPLWMAQSARCSHCTEPVFLDLSGGEKMVEMQFCWVPRTRGC